LINKTLIIGFGSIGRKHAEILSNLLGRASVYVLTQQDEVEFNSIDSFDKINSIDPDYIVVASATSLHKDHVQKLERICKEKVILIEKPLFDEKREENLTQNHYLVAYNLRFHPLINLLKDKIDQEKIISAKAVCHSFLPDWRKNIKYQESASASISKGGGVLLDLSHEIDYMQYILGDFSVNYSINKKVSNLEIDTDDYLLICGELRKGGLFNIETSYFSRQTRRKIFIETTSTSIELDIIKSRMKIFTDHKEEMISENEYSLQDTYIDQHEAILSGDFSKSCTLSEGLRTMEIISEVQNTREQ
jgi:CMP-N,N'-diacetyllegionaminic acid synthase|tara:strand:+ start:613 stop:1527 length:915 start_codon:yes stop_codon:yes gene_type:complete